MKEPCRLQGRCVAVTWLGGCKGAVTLGMVGGRLGRALKESRRTMKGVQSSESSALKEESCESSAVEEECIECSALKESRGRKWSMSSGSERCSSTSVVLPSTNGLCSPSLPPHTLKPRRGDTETGGVLSRRKGEL